MGRPWNIRRSDHRTACTDCTEDPPGPPCSPPYKETSHFSQLDCKLPPGSFRKEIDRTLVLHRTWADSSQCPVSGLTCEVSGMMMARHTGERERGAGESQTENPAADFLIVLPGQSGAILTGGSPSSVLGPASHIRTLQSQLSPEIDRIFN